MQYLSLDTEFIRRFTYLGHISLIQVATDAPQTEFEPFYNESNSFFSNTHFPTKDNIIIIDPSLAPPHPLKEYLEDNSIVKIFHAADQDIFYLSMWISGSIQNIFDTQVAAQFCEIKGTLSLQNLVKELLGYELPKSETKSDWDNRPLTEEQLKYAADDVAHLHDMYMILIEKAKELGNYEFMMDEMQNISNYESTTFISPDRAWTKLKFPIDRINLIQFTTACELAKWREKKAMEDNVPKNRILNDGDLIDISINASKITQSNLCRYSKIRPTNRYDIANVCKKSSSVKENYESHYELTKKRANPTNEDIYKELAEKINILGEDLKIDPTLIATKKDIIGHIVDPSDPENRIHKGWRATILKDIL